MLTVKHITLSGEETIYRSPTVRYEPDGYSKTAAGPSSPTAVWIEEPNTSGGVRYPLTGGTVFVMNDHGSTVGRYDLSPMPPSFGVVGGTNVRAV